MRSEADWSNRFCFESIRRERDYRALIGSAAVIQYRILPGRLYRVVMHSSTIHPIPRFHPARKEEPKGTIGRDKNESLSRGVIRRRKCSFLLPIARYFLYLGPNRVLKSVLYPSTSCSTPVYSILFFTDKCSSLGRYRSDNHRSIPRPHSVVRSLAH